MTTAFGGVAPGDVGERVARVRAKVAETFSAQAMLVSSPANIRYLTGFSGASTGLIVLPERLVLVTDSRYRTGALQTVYAPHLSHNGVELVAPGERAETIARSISKPARLVVEANSVSMADHARLSAELSGVELVPANDIVLEERLIKDAGEVARIRAAGAVSDAALEDLAAAEPLGWSELEIAAFLVERMTAMAADVAFDPIAAIGERSALAHSRPSRKRLSENAILLMDFGAEVDGYKADMTRTVWWGEVSQDLESAFIAVQEAYDAAVEMLRPGVPGKRVDEVARRVLGEYGLERFVIHPTGHNVGLEIHERPYLDRHHPGELAAGNVITVEPAVYIPDVGGIRLEDTFVVTDSGPVALTTSTHVGRLERLRADGPGYLTAGSEAGPDADPRVGSDRAQCGGRNAEPQAATGHERFLTGGGARRRAAQDVGD